MSASHLSAQEVEDVNVGIFRTVRFIEHGLAYVDDKFVIHNNGTSEITSLDVGFAREYEPGMRYLEVKDTENGTLTVAQDVNASSNVYWMRIQLARPVGFNQTYNFTSRMLFDNIIQLFQLGYVYNFTTAPILTREAEYANVTIVGTPGTDFKVGPGTIHNETRTITFEGRPAILEPIKPLPAFDNRTFAVNFTSINQWILKLQFFNRTIALHPSGDIEVWDTYKLENPALPISNVPIKLPTGARNVMALDGVGPMWTEVRQIQDVVLAPRGTTSFKANENFTVTLRYNLPREQYIKQIQWWGKYNFTFSLISNLVYWVAEEVVVKLIVPVGFGLDELSVQPDEKRQISAFEEEYIWTRSGITPLHNTTFEMEFTYAPFWALVQPASWIAAFEIAIIALAAVLRLRKPAEPGIPVPVERVRDFVELYDEKMGLTVELERMEEDMVRGGITKHEYRRRRKLIESRLDELGKALNIAKAALRTVHPRYDEMIKRLERSEAEADATKVSEQQIRGQYRSGKITRETYETVLYDLSKRIDRARQGIETTIVTLREEAR
jgi:hypothetical protein